MQILLFWRKWQQVILGAHMENYPIQMWDANVHYLWTSNANWESSNMCVVHEKVQDLIALRWMPLTWNCNYRWCNQIVQWELLAYYKLCTLTCTHNTIKFWVHMPWNFIPRFNILCLVVGSSAMSSHKLWLIKVQRSNTQGGRRDEMCMLEYWRYHLI
jgi:hypothetical protein